LADRLFAPHYARAESCSVKTPSTTLRATPSVNAPAVSQLVRGEGFELLDRAGGWAWGRCAHDDYVGYLPDAALSSAVVPSHRVTVPSALLFAAADIKSPVLGAWPIGARFTAAETGTFLDTGEGFIHRRHAASLDTVEHDAVAVAERLLGSPYLWGGRGGGGIDCSGLIQLALSFTGRGAPRDSDQQRATLGTTLTDEIPSQRGDLVFFPGHVAMMLDDTRIIHANAYWMAVTIEPLADIVARLAPEYADPILGRRRIT
jgi:cell wall-associated NlpC family hydrolase